MLKTLDFLMIGDSAGLDPGIASKSQKSCYLSPSTTTPVLSSHIPLATRIIQLTTSKLNIDALHSRGSYSRTAASGQAIAEWRT